MKTYVSTQPVSDALDSYCLTMFDSPLMGIAVTSTSGEVYVANDKFLNMLGYSRSDLSAGILDWKKLTPFEFHHTTVSANQQIAETGSARPFEKEYIKKDGSRVPVLVGVTLVKGHADRCVIFALDLTESKSVKTKMGHLGRIATLGEFTSGIIHDFNNILATVLMASEELLSNDKLAPEIKESAEVIYKSATHGAALTKRLLAFCRSRSVEPKVISLNAVISGMGDVLQRFIGRAFTLEIETETQVPPIVAELCQMEQVAMNLVANARDAMPTGGSIVVSVDMEELREPLQCVKGVNLPAGKYAKLSVLDHGTGIDAKVLENIFDPFFTTKANGEGTGLGLSTVAGIVQQMRGGLSVVSKVGVGTVVHVLLPLSHSETLNT